MSWTAPIIPARVAGWDSAGAEVLQRFVSEPFAWGTSDCLTAVAGICLAMTGVDPRPPGLPAYATEEEARAVLSSLGCRTVEDVLKRVFPVVPRARAIRFDCGVVERRIGGRPVLAAVIVNGHIALGRDDHGPSVVALRELRSTFAIGAR